MTSHLTAGLPFKDKKINVTFALLFFGSSCHHGFVPLGMRGMTSWLPRIQHERTEAFSSGGGNRESSWEGAEQMAFGWALLTFSLCVGEEQMVKGQKK